MPNAPIGTQGAWTAALIHDHELHISGRAYHRGTSTAACHASTYTTDYMCYRALHCAKLRCCICRHDCTPYHGRSSHYCTHIQSTQNQDLLTITLTSREVCSPARRQHIRQQTRAWHMEPPQRTHLVGSWKWEDSIIGKTCGTQYQGSLQSSSNTPSYLPCFANANAPLQAATRPSGTLPERRSDRGSGTQAEATEGLDKIAQCHAKEHPCIMHT